MNVSAGATLRVLRARRPLVHQITNYVVMNETANATLAIGALPVMAHAPEEVEEMAVAAGALVLNIGTLSTPWIEAMLLAGKAANAAGVPVVLDPVGAGACPQAGLTEVWTWTSCFSSSGITYLPSSSMVRMTDSWGRCPNCT